MFLSYLMYNVNYVVRQHISDNNYQVKYIKTEKNTTSGEKGTHHYLNTYEVALVSGGVILAGPCFIKERVAC